MQAFGLELRKANRESIYKDVDMVLEKAGIKDQPASKSIQAAAASHALHKMFRTDNWFCVSTVKQCAEMCQICIPKERIDIYRSIHCVSWNQMEPDFRTTITAMILDDFRPILNPS